MIDHLGVGAEDFEASRRFYDAALAPLGLSLMMEATPEQTGGYHGIGYGRDGKPFFWLSSGGARGAGVHVAFTAPNRAAVDAFHKSALEHGGRDNGAPGLRPHYHPNYYAAFAFDPIGINVEAVCHTPE
jgi:catechol 2,3-dioxygenase-like lactoylglutathione lyase family enzyme